MATTTFFIRNGRKKTSLYVIYRHGQKSKMFSTGVRIDPKHWNRGKQKVDLVNGLRRIKANEELIKELEKQSIAYNAKINTLRAKLNDIATRLDLNQQEPSVERVYNEYNEGKELKKSNFQFLKEDYLKFSQAKKSSGTIKQIKSGLKAFFDFAENNHYKLSLNMFNSELYDEYTKYLSTEIKKGEKVIKKGLNNNTVGTRIKELKTFLNWLKDHGYPVNPAYQKYKVLKENPQIIYLNQSELTRLETITFKKSHLNRTRDIFLFQCNTGLRISDLMRLDAQHIQDNIIQMRAFKNKNQLFIPLTATAKRILEKYEYRLPTTAEQVYNRQLKEMAKVANLDRLVETSDFKAGKKIFKSAPLHELVKSHIARKTFISICVEKGIQPKVVSEMAGISVKVLIDHYYGTDKENIIKEMQKAFGTTMKVS